MGTTMDYTSPSVQFFSDVNKSNSFKKNSKNYINVLGVEQLNTLDNVSLLDIFLSKNNIIEPHYHQNAAELVYCISGSAVISLLNPFTKVILNYKVAPGQVVNIPQGWWHYEIATVDDTHLLAIFNAPTPEVILGSDILALTPPNIMANSYCLDENQWKKAIAPIQPSTFIGPSNDCNRRDRNMNLAFAYPHSYLYQYQYQYPYNNFYPIRW
ncbi:cupin domain-containing protein [Bacillus tianshenii]|uniref:cupin domain-containing protein n=1 Tax=Sutcliffiella tianshenii TaxID=1463404 RepID=UPI001CD79FCF|nr:cupin domain-containing protein [Bacillus tianshenii]MCA1319391.1 cupin domain-containing protein [Bacillus tianshenii]